MKRLLLLSLLITQHITAQNISGYWTGWHEPYWTHYARFKEKHRAEMHFKQEGNFITGISRCINISTGYYSVSRITGFIDGNRVMIVENEITRMISGHFGAWCLEKYQGTLVIDSVKKKMTIRGYAVTNRTFFPKTGAYTSDAGWFCNKDTFELTRPLAGYSKKDIAKIEWFPDEPFMDIDTLTGIAIARNMKETVKPAALSGQVLDKQTLRPLKAMMYVEDRQMQEREISIPGNGAYTFTVNNHESYIIDIDAEGYEPYYDTINIDRQNMTRHFLLTPKPGFVQAVIPQPPPDPLKERKRELINTFDIVSDSLTLNFYDDGITDGDSITVYYNARMLLSRQLLTDKALTIKIPVDAGSDNELVMYANNVGSIPPNTAILVFYDGSIRKEVKIDSDMMKSGTVIFRKRVN